MSIRRARASEAGHPTLIGEDVLIGHMAMVHGCILHDRAFVGLGAIVMDGCEIESGGMLAAGAMLAPGRRIPAGQLWAGRPAKYVRDLSEAELAGTAAGRRPLCRAGEDARRGAQRPARGSLRACRSRSACASASGLAAPRSPLSSRSLVRRRWRAGAGALHARADRARRAPRVVPARAASSRDSACCASIQLSLPRRRRAPPPRAPPAEPRRTRVAAPGLAAQRPIRAGSAGIVGDRGAAARAGSSVIAPSRPAAARARKGPWRRAARERSGERQEKDGRNGLMRPPMRASLRGNTGRRRRSGVARPPAFPLCRTLPRARSSAG